MNLYGIDSGPEKSAMVRCTLTPRDELDGEWALPWGVTPVEWKYLDNQSVTEMLSLLPVGSAVGIETMVMAAAKSGKSIMDTQWWSGHFARSVNISLSTYKKINERSATSQLTGLANGTDADVRREILSLYGESLDSVKGRKCSNCKGKGWCGKDHARCKSCVLDNGIVTGLMYPKGPLFGWTLPKSDWKHIYAALTTALRAAWEIGTKEK